jgi:hypothetical protein
MSVAIPIEPARRRLKPVAPGKCGAMINGQENIPAARKMASGFPVKKGGAKEKKYVTVAGK